MPKSQVEGDDSDITTVIVQKYYKMIDERDQIGFFVLVALVITLILLVRKYLKYKKRQFKQRVQERHNVESHQQDDIYNISGRVQGQDQWPTHDAYLSIDHINTSNQLNKPNYNDAPPSYEEAMRIAESNSTGTSTVPDVVVVVPKTTD